MSRIAIGYIRVSTTQQAEEGVSLEAQKAKISDYCNFQGHSLLLICEDAGISGKRADNRPGLQQALKLVCKHKGVLVTYSLSRLGRSTRDCIEVTERLNKCGADFASITEKIDTTSSMGRFFFTVMAGLGQLEREQISERTKAGLQYKKARGEMCGAPPYGWKLGPDGVHLEALPHEQIILGAILQRRREKAGYHRIATELNEAGVPTKKGRKWRPCTVNFLVRRVA